jgi:cell division protein FtsB
MIRFLKIFLIVGLLGFLGWGVLNLEKQNRRLEIKLNNLEINSEALEKENQNLEENIKYFSHLENLVKELKSLFNYRQPGEKMIIIVPGP